MIFQHRNVKKQTFQNNNKILFNTACKTKN